jgi:uncharacterized membrane-anchored protein
MRRAVLSLALALVASGVVVLPLDAQTAPPPQMKADLQAAWAAAKRTATVGPADIKLLDEGALHIGADEVFIPAAEANGIMHAYGNPVTPGRYGLIVSRRDNANWLVDVAWIKEGYVRDGDAKDWQPDAMLDNLKQGTEAANADRIARGIPAMDVTGWVQPPAYDGKMHRLVWSLASRDRGAPASEPQTINYNTYALGRDGYFSLDLITDDKSIGADKGVAQQLLGSLNYAPGKRYEDFNGSTDKVAAYGLAALVGVVAVKKLGLLAIIGAFLFKAWKLGMIAVAGIGAAIRRFFNRGKPGEGEA